MLLNVYSLRTRPTADGDSAPSRPTAGVRKPLAKSWQMATGGWIVMSGRGCVGILSCAGTVVFAATRKRRLGACLPVDAPVNTQLAALGARL